MLIVVTVAVYFPILGNDFLDFWDDQWQVMNHYTEGGFHLDNLRAILTNYHGGQYSPVCQYLYLALYSAFGYNPFVFHLASLLFHAGCVALVFVIAEKLFSLYNKEHARAIAFCTALLFAVHPLNVESVAWISADKIVAYAFFYLGAVLTYIIFLDTGRIRYYILTLCLFVLSFGCKEQAVMLPLCLLLLHIVKGYSLKDRKIWLQLVPFFVLSVALGIVTVLSHASVGSGLLSGKETYPLWQRIVFASYALVEYITKFLVPYNLLYLYPFPMRVGEAMPGWMPVYPAIVLTIVAALWKHLSKGVVAAGLTFFLIHIALVLHVVPLSRFVVIADRYIYLAGAGLAFIAAYYLVTFLTSGRHTVRYVTIVSGLLIALCLGICSNRRCSDWKNTDSIKKEIRELLKQREAVSMPVMKSSNLKRKEFMDACPVQGVRQGTG